MSMNNIKSYLKNKNMTLYQLAKDSNVSYPTVFNIINGKVTLITVHTGF